MGTQGHTPNQVGLKEDFLQKSLQGAKITKKTNINKIVQEKPEAIEILFEAGMMCIGCPMSSGESLEQGCRAHGMSDKEIEKLIEKLNTLKGTNKVGGKK